MAKVRTPGRKYVTKEKFASRIASTYKSSDGSPSCDAFWGGKSLVESAWLKKFSEAVASDDLTAEGWEQLENRCNLCFIIDLLYAFTVREPLAVERHRDACRELSKRLSGIIELQSKVARMLSDLNTAPELLPLTRYTNFSPELLTLENMMKFFEETQRSAAEWGSYKKNGPRDWFLVLMAHEMEKSTGNMQINILILLIDAAQKAHGETPTLTLASLTKRIQRLRNNLSTLLLFPCDLTVNPIVTDMLCELDVT